VAERKNCVRTLEREHGSRLWKKSFAARGEDGVVAVAEGKLDIERATILRVGRSVIGDLASLVEAAPAEEDNAAAMFEFGSGGEASKANSACHVQRSGGRPVR
jgi:hypothetical protein